MRGTVIRLPTGIRPSASPIGDAALAGVLQMIAASATDRDGAPFPPPFPDEAFAQLEAVGALAWNATAGPRRPRAADELGLVRAVARADASVGRIFDGHLNGVERLAVQAPAELRDVSWRRSVPAVSASACGAAIRARRGLAGEARVPRRCEALSGVKTFCSGAGGLDRALVLARDPDGGPPVAGWVDLTDTASVLVDEDWYRGAGLRASVSHRVVFDRAPVMARFGPPGCPLDAALVRPRCSADGCDLGGYGRPGARERAR